MAFYHVGDCSCPEGCCDCGVVYPPIAPKSARTRRWILYRSSFREYHVQEDWKTPFKELEKLPHYITTFNSKNEAFDEAILRLNAEINVLSREVEALKRRKTK